MLLRDPRGIPVLPCLLSLRVQVQTRQYSPGIIIRSVAERVGLPGMHLRLRCLFCGEVCGITVAAGEERLREMQCEDGGVGGWMCVSVLADG
ncbi:hypothetical protein BDW71DRAFT_180918 [Aspergillus fruticulosus]